MGAYKDKLSFEERWNVIHYIRSLQAKELKLEYNQMANTLNNVDRPAGEIVSVEMQDVHGDERGHGSEESHAQDHESKEGHRGEDRGQGH